MKFSRLTFSVLLTAGTLTFFNTGLAADDTDWDCIRGFVDNGSDSLTLGEIRERCSKPAPEQLAEQVPTETAASRRLQQEREAAARPFSILAHKPNYVLSTPRPGSAQRTRSGQWREPG